MKIFSSFVKFNFFKVKSLIRQFFILNLILNVFKRKNTNFISKNISPFSKNPGKSNLEVYAHHPKLCRKDQWISISEFTFFVKKCPLNQILHRVGFLPCQNFTDLTIDEIVTGLFELMITIENDEVTAISKKFKQVRDKNSRSELMAHLLDEVGIEADLIEGTI